jgi:translocation protein SEC63
MKIALLLGGWLSVFQLSYGIYSSVQQVQVWDPFHILGVSVFSSSMVIKQRYKRKSLQFHPDKRPRWMTKEEAEAKFIDLTKAYKAYSRTPDTVNDRLTDPVLRESYLNFGHPDGAKLHEPIIGIALPGKVVHRDWQTGVMLMYLGLLLLIVPGCTAAWWIRSQSTTPQGFHEATAYRFFSTALCSNELNFAEIMTVLSAAEEITSIIASGKFEIEPFPVTQTKGNDLGNTVA